MLKPSVKQSHQTKVQNGKAIFPLSWNENRICGCVEHVTATGMGFVTRITSKCDFHRELK